MNSTGMPAIVGPAKEPPAAAAIAGAADNAMPTAARLHSCMRLSPLRRFLSSVGCCNDDVHPVRAVSSKHDGLFDVSGPRGAGHHVDRARHHAGDAAAL